MLMGKNEEDKERLDAMMRHEDGARNQYGRSAPAKVMNYHLMM